MLRDVPTRRKEGWRFRYGVDGFDFSPDKKQPETILNNYMNKFPTQEAALDWVKQRAAEGSIYHQRALEYIITAQMVPKTMIKRLLIDET